jgi:hypothetical protein
VLVGIGSEQERELVTTATMSDDGAVRAHATEEPDGQLNRR